MELVFVALPVALLVGGAALAAFVWAARSDQFEDLDSPPERVLFDDDVVRTSGKIGPDAAADAASGIASDGRSAASGGESSRDAAGLCREMLDRR
jgi:cbb3-type cytochrome oxidase maturation protein